MNEWNPIETAPKDGTIILAIGLNFGGEEDDDKGHHYALARWDKSTMRFVCANREDDDSYEFSFLTHWTDLLALPQ